MVNLPKAKYLLHCTKWVLSCQLANCGFHCGKNIWAMHFSPFLTTPTSRYMETRDRKRLACVKSSKGTELKMILGKCLNVVVIFSSLTRMS